MGTVQSYTPASLNAQHVASSTPERINLNIFKILSASRYDRKIFSDFCNRNEYGEADDGLEISISREQLFALAQGSVVGSIADVQKQFMTYEASILEAAVQKINELSTASLVSLRITSHPPELVKSVLETLCIVMNELDISETSARRLLAREDLICRLICYDKDNVPVSILRQLNKYIWDAHFTEKDILDFVSSVEFSSAQVSHFTVAAGALCEWVRALYSYSLALHELGGNEDVAGDEFVKKFENNYGIAGIELNAGGGRVCRAVSSFDQNLYIIGNDTGQLRKYSYVYTHGQYLESYQGHRLAVYAIQWSIFHPKVFLSTSADCTIKLWNHTCTTPVLTYNLKRAVLDIAWAPYCSAIFAAATSDGNICIFDIVENQHEPIYVEKVTKCAKLIRVGFSLNVYNEPIIIFHNDRGGISNMKIPLNMRNSHEPRNVNGEIEPHDHIENQIDQIEKLLLAVRLSI